MVKINHRSAWHNLTNSWKQFRLWLLPNLLYIGAIFAEGIPATIDLGPIFYCTTATPYGIFDYPSLANCNHYISDIKEPICAYKANLYKYSPNVTRFHIYHYQHHKIRLKYFERISSVDLRQKGKKQKCPFQSKHA